MDDLCCVFPVYSNVVLWLAVCPLTFLIRKIGRYVWIKFGKKSAKFRGNILSLSENIAKKFRLRATSFD